MVILQAQSVSSSCNGPDSLVAFYDFDATKLAIRHLYNINHPDTTEIVVEDSNKESVLEALLAVHQAYSLSARDEVIDFFNVHALDAPVTNSFTLYADTSYKWVQTWRNADIYTGLADIDIWVDSFDLAFSRSPQMVYSETLGGEYLKVNIQTNKNLNLKPLLEVLSQIYGIVDTEEEFYQSEIEKDIKCTIDTLGDYAELTYRYAWGDCQNGCLNEHFWTFRIFFSDCTVHFVTDGGSPLPVDEVTQISQVAIFPNPTSDLVSINLVGPAKADFILRLYDAFGRLIRSESLGFHNGLINLELDLTGLPIGVYFISLSHGNQLLTERIIKK